MPLRPYLPPLVGESLTSYMNRLAAFHGDMDVFRFLDMIELSRGAVTMPKDPDFRRIIELFGVEEPDLARMTFRTRGARVREIAGEVVHAEFANLDKTSYCPACLLEDGRAASPSKGIRVGRIAWQIESVRACDRHGIVLFRRKNVDHSEKFQLMAAVAPDDLTLASMVETAERCNPSGLSRYIVDRLAGRRGLRWLDDQPVDLAAKACEMLGVIEAFGTHVDLKGLSPVQWDEAGDIGFHHATGGEAGIRAGLKQMFDRHRMEGVSGGPQKVFGCLYLWLQFNTNKKPFGPIRDVVRDFILDHFPIEPGTTLLGEVVSNRRVHSVHSLARKTGEHPKTITRAVVLSGLAEGDPERANPAMVFDAEAGEALIRRIRSSVSVRGLEEYLNCNRVQAEQLVRTGVIPRLLPDADKVAGVLKNVAKSDADAFLERLLGAAETVAVADPEMMDIVAAAEVSRWPVLDIVRGVLQGLFGKVQIVDPALKFKAVLVDPSEVRAVLHRTSASGRIGIEEAAAIIGMPQQGLNNLLKMNRQDGEPFLQEHFVENSKGARIRYLAVADVLAFRREHVSLKEIAEAEAISPKAMRFVLEARGVAPLAPKYELGRVWYRRADLTVP